MIQMTNNVSQEDEQIIAHHTSSNDEERACKDTEISPRQWDVEETVGAPNTTSRMNSTTETGESETNQVDYYRQDSSGRHLEKSVSNDDLSPPPSNEFLLGTAFVSFMSFAVAEMVFAFIANSQAMKGDAAAMIVDSMTYLFNYVAERRKKHFDWDAIPSTVATARRSMADTNLPVHEIDLDPSRLLELKKRAYRKMVLHMEIIPPVVSVVTLLAVTSIIMYQGLLVVTRGLSTSTSQPNLGLMLGFSLFNLGLDIMNVFCFARAKHLFGYKTVHDHSHHGTPTLTTEDDCSIEDESNRTNLNMCSAYTHVFADTLRSLAVILAATIAELASAVTAEAADAMAALAVSILILLSLMPFVQGLFQSISDLRAIHAEEKMEVMMLQQGRESQ